VVDRGGLENRCGACVTVGSNPTPSAFLLSLAAFLSVQGDGFASIGGAMLSRCCYNNRTARVSFSPWRGSCYTPRAWVLYLTWARSRAASNSAGTFLM
jgi:hypothetical protein